MNSPSVVQAAMINDPSTPGDSKWFDMWQYPTLNLYDRANQTILHQTSKYTIGISKKFGGAMVEYYNNRGVDPNLNMINSHVGAGYQAALFGGTDIPHSASDCMGGQNWIWNPTQAGNLCPAPDGGWQPNYVWSCTTSLTNGCNAGTVTIGPGQTGWTQFFVRFRNFTYPNMGATWYPYQTYDEVFGYITYTFTEDWVRADYQLWRDGAGAGGSNPPPNRGAGWQQLPVLFSTQVSEFVYKKDGVITSLLHTGIYDNPDSFDVTGNDGRWATLRSNPNHGSPDPLMSPGQVFTVAFYQKAHAGSCQPRRFQYNFVSFPNSDHVTHQAIVQNRVTFEPVFPYYIEFSTMVFPYDYSEYLPGAALPLSSLVDTYTPTGFMPSWECNM